MFQSAPSLTNGTPNRVINYNAGNVIRVLPCNTAYSANTTTALVAGTWTYVVWTINGTTNLVYMNGVQEVNTTINPSNCGLQNIYVAKWVSDLL